jgi:hypothetical protein
MTTPRREPDRRAAEREMLEGWLEYHRATLQLKCEGLGAAQLAARAVPPSTLSLLGLVRHLTEVERAWFQRRLAGEDAPPLYYSDDDPDGDFDHVEGADDATVEEAWAAWRSECERSRAILTGFPSLDEVGDDAPEEYESAVPGAPGTGSPSVRWVLVHLIEEYARHNGHADLLRQRIDGATGE